MHFRESAPQRRLLLRVRRVSLIGGDQPLQLRHLRRPLLLLGAPLSRPPHHRPPLLPGAPQRLSRQPHHRPQLRRETPMHFRESAPQRRLLLRVRRVSLIGGDQPLQLRHPRHPPLLLSAPQRLSHSLHHIPQTLLQPPFAGREGAPQRRLLLRVRRVGLQVGEQPHQLQPLHLLLRPLLRTRKGEDGMCYLRPHNLARRRQLLVPAPPAGPVRRSAEDRIIDLLGR